jgi:hypothetical protein
LTGDLFYLFKHYDHLVFFPNTPGELKISLKGTGELVADLLDCIGIVLGDEVEEEG